MDNLNDTTKMVVAGSAVLAAGAALFMSMSGSKQTSVKEVAKAEDTPK